MCWCDKQAKRGQSFVVCCSNKRKEKLFRFFITHLGTFLQTWDNLCVRDRPRNMSQEIKFFQKMWSSKKPEIIKKIYILNNISTYNGILSVERNVPMDLNKNWKVQLQRSYNFFSTYTKLDWRAAYDTTFCIFTAY